jgi:threonine-phosphate decarboxylase
MIHLLQPKKALVIGPTYSEYEREIFLSGGSAHYYPLKEELDFQVEIEGLKKCLTEDIDMLVICNPNNPTSSVIPQKELRMILDHCKEKNIFVMIDETYVEFAESMEKITAIPLTECYNNLLILRGISKFFSAPGLRLGYGICGNKDLMRRINDLKNPWTINILATFGAQAMFEDEDYIQNTKELISQERNKIYNELKQWKNIKVYRPGANFVLFKLLREDIDACTIFEELIQQKMLVRDASSFPFLDARFLRFCFLMPKQNDMLLTALKQIIE